VKNLLLHTWLIVTLAFNPVLVPIAVLAQPRGVVDYSIEWGTTSHPFVYIFTGKVTCGGRPCPARVQLNLLLGDGDDITDGTNATADGSYHFEEAARGIPDEAAQWVLTARPTLGSAEQEVALEGRMILMEGQDTLVIERPIQLAQS
jgi:hypothetical protein